MKITTHRCDLCGAKRPERLLAKLHVPLTEEERALRKRTENPRRGVYGVSRSPMGEMMAHYMGMGGWSPEGGSSGVVTYDLCRECVDGLLAARFREVRKKLAMGDD